ncbi:MAG: hypothetical protein ACR2FY_18490 [Pirellulaceae bacterium]
MAQGIQPYPGHPVPRPSAGVGCILAAVACALAMGLLVVLAAFAGYLLTDPMPMRAPPKLIEWRESLQVSEESVRIIDRQLGPLTIECTARVKNVSDRRQNPVLIFQFLGEGGQEIHRRQFVPLTLEPGRDELIIRHTTMNPEEFELVKTFRVAE